MPNLIKSAGLAVATTSFAFAAPVAAAQINPDLMPVSSSIQFSDTASYGDLTYEHKRHRHHRHYRDYDDGYGHGEPVYRDTRVWRGRDGRYYCKRRDGTTGLLVGGVAGALIGREIAGRNGDRTLGAILGAAGGAILGRSIDRGNRRCR